LKKKEGAGGVGRPAEDSASDGGKTYYLFKKRGADIFEKDSRVKGG